MARMKEYNFDFNYLIEQKRDFKIKKSTSSRTISIMDEKQKPIFYTNNFISFKTFHLKKKLFEELEPFIKEVNKIMSKKDFDFNLLNEHYIKTSSEIINIDLNSAYLTALNHSGLISNELFSEIYDLKKHERLVCLGLLAYEPEIFVYENGKIKDVYSEKNKFRNFFFYCVKLVSDCMRECMAVGDEDFIFAWVDGIYLRKESEFKIELIKELIKERGFNFSEDTLTDFNVKKNNDYHEITVKDKEKIKCFNVRTGYKISKIKKGTLLKDFLINGNEESLNEFIKL